MQKPRKAEQEIYPNHNLAHLHPWIFEVVTPGHEMVRAH